MKLATFEDMLTIIKNDGYKLPPAAQMLADRLLASLGSQKIYVVKEIYDLGSGHPECSLTVTASSAEAMMALVNLGIRENLPDPVEPGRWVVGDNGRVAEEESEEALDLYPDRYIELEIFELKNFDMEV